MDKSKLLANRVTGLTAEVEVEGVGTLTVRALSRHELIESAKKDGDAAQERYILSRAVLDPVLGEHDVAEWQKNSVPGEINTVAAKINELSGLKKGADKSDVREIRDES